MGKRRLLCIFVIVLSTLVIFTGCEEEPVEDVVEEPEEPEEVTTIILGHILAAGHTWDEGAKKFAEVLERETDGAFEVRIHPGAELGDEPEMMESMQVESIHMGIISTAKGYVLSPAVGFMDMPYMFDDWEHLRRCLDGEVGETLNQRMLDDTGLRSLGWIEQGFRHTITADAPIQTIDEFDGLTIRTPDGEPYVKTFELLGANPTVMAFGEVFTGLETGVVDGLEGSFETIYTDALHEVTDYISLTNHIVSVAQFLISDSFYQRQSSEHQEAIDKAVEEAIKHTRDIVIKRDDEYKAQLIEDGMIIDDTLLTNEYDLLVEATEGYVGGFAKDVGIEHLIDVVEEKR